MILIAATGFFTSISLILAIGAQNAFVLRQGLTGKYVFSLSLLCALSDAILISLGVAGFGYLVTLYPGFPTVMAYLGAAFLITYGTLKLRTAWRGDYTVELSGKSGSYFKVMATGFALTWFNPHVYLDTLGLIGAVSTQYPQPGEKLVFGLAAITASFVFFFALGYGARLLAPIMRTAKAWRRLDILIAGVMFTIAVSLLRSSL